MYFRVFQRWWCISPPSLPPWPTSLGERALSRGPYTHTDHWEAGSVVRTTIQPQESGPDCGALLNDGAGHPELQQDAAEAEAQDNEELPVEPQTPSDCL